MGLVGLVGRQARARMAVLGWRGDDGDATRRVRARLRSHRTRAAARGARRTDAALGVATARCLRDDFRLPVEDTKARLAELVEAGELLPVTVEGWRQTADLWHRARVPRRIEVRAPLAPFDPLIWQRERVDALFGARIRLEIHTPAEQRTHGYYVPPFLLGERIAARLDPKADRAAGRLCVRAAHLEPDATTETVLAPLAAELRLMARWLGLHTVAVERRGDLAHPLAAHLAPRRRRRAAGPSSPTRKETT